MTVAVVVVVAGTCFLFDYRPSFGITLWPRRFIVLRMVHQEVCKPEEVTGTLFTKEKRIERSGSGSSTKYFSSCGEEFGREITSAARGDDGLIPPPAGPSGILTKFNLRVRTRILYSKDDKLQ